MKHSAQCQRFANWTAVVSSLLAVTFLLAPQRSSLAESPATTTAAAIPAPTGPMVTLAKHTSSKVLNGEAVRVGRYNPEQKLRLALGIKAPHMAEEEKFLNDLVTKGSPSFHKFLSADEWNSRYAPSAADEQKVVDWATSQGLTVTHRYANRLLVDVEAPAGTIESAFGVTINNYKVGEEVDFSNDRDPVIPAKLSGVLFSVLGLNSIDRFSRASSHGTIKKGPDYVAGPAITAGETAHKNGDPAKKPANRAARPAFGVKPEDGPPLDDGVADPANITSSEAYDYDALHALSHCCNEPGASAGSPPESSIALVTYGNFELSDVNNFVSAYGFAYYISSFYINGSAFPGQDDEAPLDVEYSTAMSNSYGSYLDTAHVYVYEMPNNQYATYADAYNQIASDNNAKVVSTSYGWNEGVGFSNSQANSTMHPIFNTMVGEGFTLIASAGDNGAADGCVDATNVDYPASDPDFVAAGGTQLQLDSNGNFVSEQGWVGETYSGACANNHGGGGGGVSANFAAPPWQVSDFNNSNRFLPDISLTANPDVMGEWYYYNGTRYDEGGTSIVAPELAGFFAQENAYLDYIGSVCGAGSTACSPIGNPAPFIWDIGQYGAPHNPYYDMVSGCNSNDITNEYDLTYYCAHSNYDLVTGWGSANMMQLAWGLNWELIPAVGTPSISFNTSPPTNTWSNSTQFVGWSVSDSGGSYPAPGVAGFTQAWDTLPPDPQSEATGGSGNSFYSGPQFPFATSGCLDTAGTECAGGSGEGCHTVQVQAWDNQGRSATNSYGPLCYDSVAPVTTAALSGTTSRGAYISAVKVTLSATDASSGVKTTYYSLDSAAYVAYSAPFTVAATATGNHTVYYYSQDVAGNNESVNSLSFTIEPATPVVSLSPTSLAFGSVKVGTTTASQTVTLTNSGYTSLTISSVAVTGSGASSYAFSNTGCTTVAAGSTCTIHGHFAPTAVGSFPATITITDNAAGSPQTVALTGSGYTASTLSFSPTSLAFGNQKINTTSASLTVTVTNTGSSSATFSSVAVTGSGAAAYAFSNTGCTTVAAGGTCTIHGHFAPTAVGSYPAAITVTDNATGSPQTIALSGTGVNPTTLSFSPSSLAFGNVKVGTSTASLTVTVTNTGSTSATFSSIAVTGAGAAAYAFSNTGCTTVAAGGTCTIHGHFAPTAATSYPAAITVTDNATGSPQTIALSGTGVNATTLSFSPASLTFASQTVGTSSASQTVTVTNTGSASATFSSIAVTGSGASSFAFSNTGCTTLAAGATCTIHGHFSPTVTGAISAAITVTDTATGSPQSIALSGTGK